MSKLINVDMVKREGSELIAYFNERGISSRSDQELIMRGIIQFNLHETTMETVKEMEEKKNGPDKSRNASKRRN